MVYSYNFICISLLLLELVNILNGRPQSERTQVNLDTTIDDKNCTKRSVEEVTLLKFTNKTKEERILNTSNRGGYTDQDIIFPDSFELIFEAIPRLDGVPKCADGNTFCENFDNYPYFHLKDILRTHEVDKEFFFGEDEIPTELEKRIGADEETFVCGAVDRIVFPKIGKNKNNEWKFIVNQGKEDGYVQGVRTETCRHQGEPCDIIGELPDGFKTSCKQKYIYRRLLSLNDNGSPIPDTFQLPSACCCSYKRDLSFLSRFGKAGATPAKK